MEKLDSILKELGISKVKLAKFLGVSRQMIYNYLELDDINKWPKDKKVLLLNLLGIKSAEELNSIKIDTDYISEVEVRLNSICNENDTISSVDSSNSLLAGLGKKEQELLLNIIDLLKEKLDDHNDTDGHYTVQYLYHFLQSVETNKVLKYILGYVAKEAGFVKPMEFVFNEEEQFIFESIMYSAFVLYNSGGASKTKLAECHKRFTNQIEQKREEKLSRTLELNNIKVLALKELGYTEINEHNAAEVFEKIAEIQSRKVGN
jgi:predicted transcriptional regulator